MSDPVEIDDQNNSQTGQVYHQAERFLTMLDPEATRFTFQTFDDSKDRKDPRLVRVLHGSLDEHFEALCQLNVRGAGVFVTVNETDFAGRSTENIVRVRALFVDLDGQPKPQDFLTPSIEVETSDERWHLYYKVTDVTLDEFTAKQKGLIAKFGSDPSVHDLPRVMRLPGFFHRKKEPRLVRITGSSDAVYSGDQFPNAEEPIGIDESPRVENEFDKLNTLALQTLSAWVPDLFGDKARPYKDGYRVKAKALNRGLEEDIGIHPKGIVDFGVADQGDPRKGKRGAIGLVMEWGKKDFNNAVQWLADRLGVPPPSILLSPNSPMQTASAFLQWECTDHRGRRALYRHRGAFALYEHSCYRIEPNDERVRSGIWRFLDKAKKRTDNGPRPFHPKKVHVSNVLEALGAQCLLSDRLDPPFWLNGGDDMPPAVEFFACGNGLLHVPTRMLYPPTPDYFGVTASTVAYDENAPEPVQWLEFLKQVLEEDDAITALQDWMGYLLTPDTSQQKILLCIGPKRSGKGTVGRTMRAVLGQGSVAGPTMSSLCGSFGLQGLITKTLAIIPDARIGQRTDKAAVVERLLSISGEDALSVQRKFLIDWDGRLPTRLQIMTNELPALTEGSGALASRYVLLTFPNSFFGRENPALEGKLRTELPGILNWATEGYRRLRQRGHFMQPKNAAEQIEQIEMLGAPVKAFLRDRCEVGPGFRVAVDDLWERWKAWCEHNGPKDRVGTKDWFGRNLRSAVPGLTTTKSGPRGDRERFYQGVRPIPERPGRSPRSGGPPDYDEIPF